MNTDTPRFFVRKRWKLEYESVLLMKYKRNHAAFYWKINAADFSSLESNTRQQQQMILRDVMWLRWVQE